MFLNPSEYLLWAHASRNPCPKQRNQFGRPFQIRILPQRCEIINIFYSILGPGKLLDALKKLGVQRNQSKKFPQKYR